MKTLKVLNKAGEVTGTVAESIVKNPKALRAFIEAEYPNAKQKEQFELTLHQANNFANVAAQIFHKHLNKKINEIDPSYLAPFIVNSTFSLELFLKTLHQSHKTKSFNRVSGEHNLKELYFSLPGKIQNKLKQSVINCLLAQNKPADNIVLDDRVRELANAFVDWRYMHEKDTLKIRAFNDLIIIMGAFYNSCVDLNWYVKRTSSC